VTIPVPFKIHRTMSWKPPNCAVPPTKGDSASPGSLPLGVQRAIGMILWEGFGGIILDCQYRMWTAEIT